MQAIQKRIGSIVVTQQISRAMLLVSNTKVQRARRLRDDTRPFYAASRHELAAVAGACRWQCGAYSTPRGEGPVLYVVIGSDRGLCGAYNLNILKHTLDTMRTGGDEAAVVAVGVKIRDLMRRRERRVLRTFTGISQSPFYSDAKALAAYVLDLFLKGEARRVMLCYTEFESMLRQHPRCVQLLPVTQESAAFPEGAGVAAPSPAAADAETAEAPAVPPLMELEPATGAVLGAVVPRFLSASLFMALASGSVCEQSSRIASMDSAVKNSEELIEKLQLAYNQARQGAITQEVNEVVSGAEALREAP